MFSHSANMGLNEGNIADYILMRTSNRVYLLLPTPDLGGSLNIFSTKVEFFGVNALS